MRRRIIKELRGLALPAAFIAGGSLLVMVASWTTALAHFAPPLAATLFFVGGPLLAASAFGAEFQHQTLSVLLAQPISRTRIWLEKCGALLATAVVLCGLQLFVLDTVGVEHIRPAAAILYFVAVMCAGPLWTLLARSTIGGAAFTAASLLVVELAGGFSVQWMGVHEFQGVIFTDSPALAALRLAYAALTLLGSWLVFLRLQVTSQMAGNVTSPLPGIPLMREVLRCRRSGAVRNLFRKELRLHTPALIVAAAFAACWLLAVALFLASPPRHPIAEMTFTVLLAMYLPLALVVVSTVPMGEDYALGIHSWHLTLPVRPAVHWLVKLTAMLIVAGITLVALPAAMHAVASAALGATGWVPELPKRVELPFAAAAAALSLCFWCASLFGGAIRAAVAATVIGFVTSAAAALVMEQAQTWPVAESFFTWVMVKYQLPPDYFIETVLIDRSPARLFDRVVVLLLALMCGAVLAMSVRAFRQGRVERRLIVRQVGVLLVSVVLMVGTTFGVLHSAYEVGRSVPVRELQNALLALSPAPVGTGPVDVPLERIARELSPSTREWLRDSEIRLEHRRGRPAADGRRPLMIVGVSVIFPKGRTFKDFYITTDQNRQ
jgi:hypothetical protein